MPAPLTPTTIQKYGNDVIKCRHCKRPFGSQDDLRIHNNRNHPGWDDITPSSYILPLNNSSTNSSKPKTNRRKQSQTKKPKKVSKPCKNNTQTEPEVHETQIIVENLTSNPNSEIRFIPNLDPKIRFMDFDNKKSEPEVRNHVKNVTVTHPDSQIRFSDIVYEDISDDEFPVKSKTPEGAKFRETAWKSSSITYVGPINLPLVQPHESNVQIIQVELPQATEQLQIPAVQEPEVQVPALLEPKYEPISDDEIELPALQEPEVQVPALFEPKYEPISDDEIELPALQVPDDKLNQLNQLYSNKLNNLDSKQLELTQLNRGLKRPAPQENEASQVPDGIIPHPWGPWRPCPKKPRLISQKKKWIAEWEAEVAYLKDIWAPSISSETTLALNYITGTPDFAPPFGVVPQHNFSNGPFICEFCSAEIHVSQSFEDLVAHYETNHSGWSSENVQCSKCKMIYETNHLWMLHFFPYEYCHRKSLIESGNNSITPPPPGFHDYFRIPDVKPQLNVEPKVPQLPITTKGVSPNLLEKTKNQEPKKRNDSGYDSAHDKNLKTRKIDIKEDQEKIKNTEDLKLKIKRIKVGEGESYYTIKKDGKEKK